MYQALTERVGYVPGGVNIGVIRIDHKHVLLVDTGLNDSTARKVLRWVKEGIDSEVVGVLTTHGHADHFGAHAFVVKRTGATIFAPEHDAAVIRNPLLQPVFLYGGADPVDALRSKFLLAEAAPLDEEFTAGNREFLGVEVEVISLPGHSMNQMAFLVDGVCFCADVVFPQAAIEKYGIPYLYGLTDHINSLEKARSIEATTFVPGHGPIHTSLDEPYASNRAVIDRTLAAVQDAIAEPVGLDDVAAHVFTMLNVPIADPSGYYLLRPTIGAYLSHLERSGAAHLTIQHNRALWSRT